MRMAEKEYEPKPCWQVVDQRAAFLRKAPVGTRVQVRHPSDALPIEGAEEEWSMGRLTSRDGFIRLDTGVRLALPARGFRAYWDPLDFSHVEPDEAPAPELAELFAAMHMPSAQRDVARKGKKAARESGAF